MSGREDGPRLTATEQRVMRQIRSGYICCCRRYDPRSYVEMRNGGDGYPVRVGRSVLAALVRKGMLEKQLTEERMVWSEPEPLPEGDAELDEQGAGTVAS